MQELLNTDQRVTRSIYEALRDHLILHGYHPDVSVYTDPQDPIQVANYKAAIDQIIQTKGFHIELFSESSARNKGKKEAPRIVILLDRNYNGEIGAPPTMLMDDEANPGNYKTGSLPGLAANLVYAIHLISSNSEQTYVLNSVLSNVLGQRSFIKLWDAKEGDTPFLVYQTAFINLDDPVENINEKAYYYTAPDIFLGDNITHRDNIKPIKEIKVKIEPMDDTLEVKSSNTGFNYTFNKINL